jgi:fructokinase
MSLRIGIDLGGTKIEVIALDADGVTLLRHRIATPTGNYAATLDAVAELVRLAEHSTGRQGTVGVATPGAISRRTGLMKNSNSTVLNGRPLDRDLARRLGRPIRMENDANCFALSEAIDGAAADARTVFGVILGTGVGGGVVIERHVLIGRNRIAGEWGHNTLPSAGTDDLQQTPCYCGKSGCIETYLSGAGLARDFQHRTGRQLGAEAIARAAAGGEPHARQTIDAYAGRLARGLASVINVVDPDCIVLGGGLSNIAELYSAVPPLIGQYAFSDGVDTPIVRAQHGDSSGVRGAAWLWQ